MTGEHYGEKVSLLKEEGVRNIDEKRGRIGSPVWKGFA